MLGPCSAPGMPGWLERVREKLEEGDYSWILSTPRIALLLRLAGMERLDIPGLPGLTLGCCAKPFVQVNGGGLYSENEWAPNTDQVYRVESLRVEPFSYSASCGETPMVMNPLGWVNFTPLVLENNELADSCPSIEDVRIVTGGLEPLNNTQLSRACATQVPTGRDAGLKPFSLVGMSVSGSLRGGIVLLGDRSGGRVLLNTATRSALAFVEDLTITTPYYDVDVHILGPATFFSLHTMSLEGSANAMSISGPLGSLAVASSRGFLFRLEPGKLRLESKGRVRIGLGGPLLAARLLHEDAVFLVPREACGRGLGHLRSSGSIVFLSNISKRRAVISGYSPVSDGIGEARFYVPVRKVTVRDVHGDDVIPVSGDLVRLPLPFGFCGEIEVELGGSLFLRLASRRKQAR